MRNVREILRQKWALKRSNRETGRSVGVSPSVVHATVERALGAGLDWAAIGALTEEELEARLYPTSTAQVARAVPDCAHLHAERLKPGVTLELLHLEYLEQHPGGYGYTRFCELYREWLK